MNALGQKKMNPKFIGSKNYYLNSIGNKIQEKSSKVAALKGTSDGIIDNYSNHSHSIYEPIKGVEIKSNKSKFVLERPKKNKSNNQYL